MTGAISKKSKRKKSKDRSRKDNDNENNSDDNNKKDFSSRGRRRHRSDDNDDDEEGSVDGGTYDVAYTTNTTGAEEDEEKKSGKEYFLEGRSEDDVKRIDKYLEGPHPHHSKVRNSLYQKEDDDIELSTKNLSAHQKRSFDKRRNSSKKGRKKIDTKLERLEYKKLAAATAAADAQVVLHTEDIGLIEVENDMERTTRLSQKELKNKHLSRQTAQNIYDLRLGTGAGSYGIQFDRSGRHGLLYGGKHISLMDCHLRSLVTEFHLPGDEEVIRDVTFLHNSSLFAVAQRNHVYIYDDNGAEIHHCKDHIDPMALEYLPHHWLMASVGRAGYLKYHDVSTGTLISEHRTKMGPCNVLRQNLSNAILHCGHTNGTVTLWSPSSSTYLVKMLCHKGAPITSMAISASSNTMITGGADRQIRIWDLRTYKELHSYTTYGGIPSSLDVSQRDVLGVGHGPHATFWKPEALQKKERNPYMHHSVPTTTLRTLRFRPYEDVCGLGHNQGISSIVIPGSGEPNLDTNEYHTNPYQDNKQRREAEVRSLLDKLQPNMIALDPDVVGTVEPTHLRQERLKDLQDEANNKEQKKPKLKKKKRGKSKIKTQVKRKSQFAQEDMTKKLRESKKEDEEESNANTKSNNKDKSNSDNSPPSPNAPIALKRFFT